MDLAWFRMNDVRRKKLDNAVWIPLRVIEHPTRVGTHGMLGFEEEFVGLGSIAVPSEKRQEAEQLGWDSVGISRENRAYVDEGRYVPADVFEDGRGTFQAVPLVLEQPGNRDEPREWHLHQDLVLALGLRREGDSWVSMNEGYVEVARLRRDGDGVATRFEVRAEHLKDYLCARGMALYVSSYRARTRVIPVTDDLAWLEKRESEIEGLDRWEGDAYAIHAGGMAFGAETAVFHAARTDVASDDDVPVMGLPGNDNIESRSWTIKQEGPKLIRVEGRFWRREWIEPGTNSPRVRDDRLPPNVYFLTDTKGSRENRSTLEDGGRWLWFRPEVITALAHRRGGHLTWYTRDTGAVRASPDYDVHFGLNAIGLVVAYAKDIVFLPEWQQRIWAAHNVSPEGGISVELHASQVLAEPAATQAPEAFLGKALENLDQVAFTKLGVRIIRDQETRSRILRETHRFRATDRAGLYALAKDIARLTADSIDASALQKVVAPPKKETWGSLKSLEKVVAAASSAERARTVMGPLVAAYELRHGDAHLAGNELDEALTLGGIDVLLPSVHQGTMLLDSCVTALYQIAEEIERYGKGAS